jgi:hypothetical protein
MKAKNSSGVAVAWLVAVGMAGAIWGRWALHVASSGVDERAVLRAVFVVMEWVFRAAF